VGCGQNMLLASICLRSTVTQKFLKRFWSEPSLPGFIQILARFEGKISLHRERTKRVLAKISNRSPPPSPQSKIEMRLALFVSSPKYYADPSASQGSPHSSPNIPLSVRPGAISGLHSSLGGLSKFLNSRFVFRETCFFVHILDRLGEVS